MYAVGQVRTLPWKKVMTHTQTVQGAGDDNKKKMCLLSGGSGGRGSSQRRRHPGDGVGAPRLRHRVALYSRESLPQAPGTTHTHTHHIRVVYTLYEDRNPHSFH